MEPEALGIEVLVRSWLERLPTCFTSEMKAKLLLYYEQYMTPGFGFLRTFLKEQVPTVNNNLVQSLQRILDCYFEPYHEVEGREPMTKTEIKAMGDSLESLFIFSFIWSICATVDHAGRDRFSSMIRRNACEWSQEAISKKRRCVRLCLGYGKDGLEDLDGDNR